MLIFLLIFLDLEISKSISIFPNGKMWGEISRFLLSSFFKNVCVQEYDVCEPPVWIVSLGKRDGKKKNTQG